MDYMLHARQIFTRKLDRKERTAAVRAAMGELKGDQFHAFHKCYEMVAFENGWLDAHDLLLMLAKADREAKYAFNRFGAAMFRMDMAVLSHDDQGERIYRREAEFALEALIEDEPPSPTQEQLSQALRKLGINCPAAGWARFYEEAIRDRRMLSGTKVRLEGQGRAVDHLVGPLEVAKTEITQMLRPTISE